ncbi:MAG: fibronectin type III domain-containing protein, partial [Bacteroidales bacterium]|nr:fibronectin type III domain-containing protein [Bacteroidales bacterium]
MKKQLFFLMAIIFAIQGFTQTTVTIGSGTTGVYNLPLNSYWNYSYAQQIYTADEIGAQTGVITSIGFQYVHASPMTVNNVKIFIGNTSNSSFATSTSWIPTSSMQEVYNGNITFENGWVYITLDNYYQWDNISNLVVCVINGNGDYENSNPRFNVHTNPGGQGSLYIQNDDNPYSSTTSPTSGTINANRNNIKFIFDTPPTCPAPTALQASNPTSSPTSFNFGWTDASGSLWNIQYMLADQTDWANATTITGVITNPYTINGLNPDTEYKIRIQTNCGTELSDWTNPITYTTPCAPVNTFPWNESFEGITATNELPPCWSATNLGSKTYTQISNYGSRNRNARTGTKSAYFSWSCNDKFTTPNFNLTAGQSYDFSFWYVTDGSSGWQSLKAGVSQVGNQASYQVIGTPLANITNPSYELYMGSFTPTTTGLYKFTIECQATSSPYYLTIDDISLSLTPNCPNVYGLAVGAASTTSVSVNWDNTGDSGDGFKIAYSTNISSAFNPATATKITIPTGTTLPYIIPGFTAGDSVWVAVQRNCGGNWSNAVKVNLPKFANSLPFIANFENTTLDTIWTISNGTQTNKWYIGTPGANDSNPSDAVEERGLYISSDNGLTATYNNGSASVVLASTLVAFDNSPSFELSFDWANYGESGWDGINVYLLPLGETLTPGTLPNAQYKLNPEYLTLQSNFQTYTQAYGAEYSNSIKQLVFCWRNDGIGGSNPPAKIDNISLISYSCAIPSGLTSLSSTNNSLTLDWDATDDANVNSWIVEYKPIDDTEWLSQNVTSHPYELTGLQSSTVYQVRITSICSLGDTNNPSEIENFGMPCETISNFPWNEGFEKVWFVAAGLNTATHPWCWTNFDGGASTSYYWRKTTSSSYIHSGSGALQMYAGNTTGQLGDWIITPTITLTGNQILGFWAKGYSTYTDDLSV